MNRQDKIDELYQWAKVMPVAGIESQLFTEALRRYRCSYPTAESYAHVVTMMIQDRKKIAAVH